MVCSGRLPPPTWLGWPGCSVKPAARLCRLIPVPGTTTPEPQPTKLDWISDTIRPSASAAATYTVPPHGGTAGPKSPARAGSMRPASAARRPGRSQSATRSVMAWGSARPR